MGGLCIYNTCRSWVMREGRTERKPRGNLVGVVAQAADLAVLRRPLVYSEQGAEYSYRDDSSGFECRVPKSSVHCSEIDMKLLTASGYDYEYKKIRYTYLPFLQSPHSV